MNKFKALQKGFTPVTDWHKSDSSRLTYIKCPNCKVTITRAGDVEVVECKLCGTWLALINQPSTSGEQHMYDEKADKNPSFFNYQLNITDGKGEVIGSAVLEKQDFDHPCRPDSTLKFWVVKVGGKEIPISLTTLKAMVAIADGAVNVGR